MQQLLPGMVGHLQPWPENKQTIPAGSSSVGKGGGGQNFLVGPLALASLFTSSFLVGALRQDTSAQTAFSLWLSRVLLVQGLYFNTNE